MWRQYFSAVLMPRVADILALVERASAPSGEQSRLDLSRHILYSVSRGEK